MKDEAPVGWLGYRLSLVRRSTPRSISAFAMSYQAKHKDYPRLGSVVGYSAVKAAAAALRRAGTTDTERLVAAMVGLAVDTPFGKVTF